MKVGFIHEYEAESLKQLCAHVRGIVSLWLVSLSEIRGAGSDPADDPADNPVL